jgi:hypothetical protein
MLIGTAAMRVQSRILLFRDLRDLGEDRMIGGAEGFGRADDGDVVHGPWGRTRCLDRQSSSG